jgi:hypothetical protein
MAKIFTTVQENLINHRTKRDNCFQIRQKRNEDHHLKLPGRQLSLLNPKRHSRNSLIVSLGEQLVDAPTLLLSFKDWRECNQGIRLSDHMDDIEREFDEFERLGVKTRSIRSR